MNADFEAELRGLMWDHLNGRVTLWNALSAASELGEQVHPCCHCMDD